MDLANLAVSAGASMLSLNREEEVLDMAINSIATLYILENARNLFVVDLRSPWRCLSTENSKNTLRRAILSAYTIERRVGDKLLAATSPLCKPIVHNMPLFCHLSSS